MHCDKCLKSEDGNKHKQCHFPKNELNVSCDICLQLWKLAMKVEHVKCQNWEGF